MKINGYANVRFGTSSKAKAKGLADEMEAHGFDRDKAVKAFNRKLNKYRRDCRRTVPESDFAIRPYL